ncbi:MAG: N-6 DNA methylase [Chloroflexota bacterium]|nr:N-6 DNA methylase [Chloroflexota bacterium]
MSHELDLAKVDTWRTALGLLPVPLFTTRTPGQRFVLLNGNRGNFCLDLEESHVGEQGRNYAWSSNVGHYVVVGEKYVEVQRWDQRQSALERYSSASVCENLEEFHAYLEKDIPKQGVSVVSHVIGVFRRLRATLGRNYSGTDSLRVFLYLLDSTADGSGSGKIIPNDWDLSGNAVSPASLIREADWHALQEDLLRGREGDDLVPNITLLLRHASGQLFQEAHYEAIFGPQFSFGGFLPSPVKVSNKHEGRGVHFTPSALARTLVESALFECHPVPQNLVVFDPACGSGEFLREVLRQLELSGYSGHLKLIGWDVSEAASEMARFVLTWEKRNTKLNVDYQVSRIDSLAHDWPQNVDIILMNPPFTSWQDMDSSERQTLKEMLGSLITMRPDLSYAFLWKAESCLRSKGLLGTVLPASVLDASSATRLRKKLAETLSPILVARLGNPLMFQGAMIDSALYVARKGAVEQSPIAFWADHRSTSSSGGLRYLRKARLMSRSAYPIVRDGFSIYENPNLGLSENSWAPRPYDSWMLLNSLNRLPKVKDLFDVKQGVRSGYNKAFILDKVAWLDLPADERKFFRPAVINKSIQRGCLNDLAYIFYPYGNLRIENENELAQSLKSYYQSTLFPCKASLISRAKIDQKRWWELTWHRDWQTDRKAKLVSTSFGDSGSFAWDDSGDYVVCQGYAWLPRKGKVLSSGTSLAYLAILNSRLFSELLSATSNNVGGGQWNLSTKFVDMIAIPDLLGSGIRSSTVATLCEIGEQIYSGKMDRVDKELLEEAIKVLYGVGTE